MKFKKYFFAVYSDIGLWFCSGAGKHISWPVTELQKWQTGNQLNFIFFYVVLLCIQSGFILLVVSFILIW